ncbi:MAG: efflux RND transporter permease subunit [Candidatus Sericytochromatia bacterium]|nr:efflux RND transporter permease subunit [Candidatus Tanganyikabacteria bacterium]
MPLPPDGPTTGWIERLIGGSARNPFLVLLFVTFLTFSGLWAIKQTPLDAIPDLSDVQVIVYTEWMGRSPSIVEDQVTYPIVTSMLSAPKVQAVRGFSFFGVSFVYVIFNDGTDIYWARSRVLETLAGLEGKFPAGVVPTLGPDATGVGWGFQYALVDETGKHDLAQLRSLQDWSLRYWLKSVPGVADVATVGGFPKQYQVNLDPAKLAAYNVPISKVMMAIKTANNDVGGRVVEWSGREYAVRGKGYIKSINDIEQIPVMVGAGGVPVRVADIGRVQLGSDMRRGVADLDGKGEVVGGVVVVRFGENVLLVIDRVKEKLAESARSLPPGVKVVTTYDRTDLIKKSIKTLQEKLIEESIVVSLVCVVFLFHFRSALVAIITLPLAIIMSFLVMRGIGLSSNIMSLGGIAIAIGAMVDAAIVMIENAHKRLEHAPPGADRREVVIAAAKEVGKPLFFALLIITVSFLPVFTLEAQEGRLFKPLAFTKTFAMFFASLLSVTLVPLLMVWLVRGRIMPEHANPVNRFLIWAYAPFVKMALRWRWPVIGLAALTVGATVPIYQRLGSEFMPPLYEGTFLYMPTGLPGMSVTEAGRLLQVQDKLLASVPEVASVFGKSGRAETATDPAPFEMFETTINLKPRDEWRAGMTPEKLIAELDLKMQFPGIRNAWTMPIKARLDMLSTGIRTPLGIKVLGNDLPDLQEVGNQLEATLSKVKGTRNVFAERVLGGYYYDLTVDRQAAARYGLTVGEVQDVIETAIGGMVVTTTVEGRERYTVLVRYARELRDTREKLARILVPAMGGAQVPLSQLAKLEVTMGPPVIRSEAGQLAAYVYVDVADPDFGGYVARAKAAVDREVKVPAGTVLDWSGQYENMQRARDRLQVVVPLTLGLIFLLLYLNFRTVAQTLIVLLSIPFSVVGSFWLLWALGYNLSVAVWVGLIALAGVAAETGVVMIVYLDEAYAARKRAGLLSTTGDLARAITEGAVQRVRPKMMTVCAIMLGLLPIMWGHGEGSDVMRRIAAPMIGGMISSTLLTLIVIPAIYMIWRSKGLARGPATDAADATT